MRRWYDAAAPPAPFARRGAAGATLPRCDPISAGRAMEGATAMGMYIIAEPCIGTKDTACVEVCPVDCIHPKKDEDGFAAATQLYIDPNSCIQCGNCEPVCPVKAIFTEETIPEKWKHYQEINAAHFA
jgi:ferredoxin